MIFLFIPKIREKICGSRLIDAKLTTKALIVHQSQTVRILSGWSEVAGLNCLSSRHSNK